MKMFSVGERSAAICGALLGLAIAGCGDIHEGTGGSLPSPAPSSPASSSAAEQSVPPEVVEAARVAPACNGTAGQWAGCRGNGCAVCAEKLTEFPNYFKNHPSCVKNTTCAGQFFTCNAKCPAPTDADRATPPNMCDGVAGGWQGCRGTGCWACSELTDAYPAYFTNHPVVHSQHDVRRPVLHLQRQLPRPHRGRQGYAADDVRRRRGRMAGMPRHRLLCL